MNDDEYGIKDSFRALLEETCRRALREALSLTASARADAADGIELKCFGSMGSGFATKSSDMDLAFVSAHSDPPADSPLSPIPRVLERAFLDMGFGARLLTRTRVPIIKLCQEPTPELLQALRMERARWERGCTEADDEDEAVEDGQDQGAASTDAAVDQSLSEESAITFSQGAQENLAHYYHRGRAELEKRCGGDGQKAQGTPASKAIVIAWHAGLYDDGLKHRLEGYRSFDFDAYPRSLAGLWYQAEGERLVRCWEGRTVHEGTPAKEQQGATLVSEWRKLQDEVSSDMVVYERQLHRSWDRLKQLPSATLGIFSEQADDSARSYYRRALSLLRNLGGRDVDAARLEPLSTVESDILAAVVTQYVDGLRTSETREAVQTFLCGRDLKEVSLAQIYGQHHAECQIRASLGGPSAAELTGADRGVVDEYVASVRAGGATSVPRELAARFQAVLRSSSPATSKARNRFGSKLDFPDSGVGIQCDVNFSNRLALHNTLLLRCYAHCDSRVRPMVLFVKQWAKRRRINSPYHGTLSSYGYVLMVLHYLVNIARPPVVPNLQMSWHTLRRDPTRAGRDDGPTEEGGYDVRFWRDEVEIRQLAAAGRLTQNGQSVGQLLLGFFEYFARQGPQVAALGFAWSADVLSLRSPMGLLTKRSKDWTGAKTTVTEPTQAGERRKEVRHRYLFAIEDPFETDHNVARTVTHNGIVAIRDEFRRAWAIIGRIGVNTAVEESELFRDATPEHDSGRADLAEAGRRNSRQEIAGVKTWDEYEVIGTSA